MAGFPPGAHRIGGAAAAQVNAELAAAFYGPLVPLVVELRRQGLSLRAIAAELERRGLPTRQGFRRWSPVAVNRVLARALASAGSAVAPASPAPVLPNLARPAHAAAA